MPAAERPLKSTYKLLALIAIGLVAALSFLAFLSLSQNHFWSNLNERIAAGETSVRIRDLTTFHWDTLCLIPGYPKDLDRLLMDQGVEKGYESHIKNIEWIKRTSDAWLAVFISGNTIVSSSPLRVASIQVRARALRVGSEGCAKYKTAQFVVSGNNLLLKGSED